MMTQHPSALPVRDIPSPEVEYPYLLRGFCPICESNQGFIINGPYFRNTAKCLSCDSLPRHRALFCELAKAFPDWQQKSVHECSPGWDSVSKRLASECSCYVASHYNAELSRGAKVDTAMPCKVYQCEDIESQTFRDNSFDIVIMQDVFEHVFNPMKAFQEVERTLKINGSLIMTVPLVKAYKPTQRRAQVDSNGNTLHILEPEYHGNPIDPLGSLVTFDWGYDIVRAS